jgi:hypothetical protein
MSVKMEDLVRVHGPTMTFVPTRTRRGSMKVDPATMEPGATPEDASVSSEEWR